MPALPYTTQDIGRRILYSSWVSNPNDEYIYTPGEKVIYMDIHNDTIKPGTIASPSRYYEEDQCWIIKERSSLYDMYSGGVNRAWIYPIIEPIGFCGGI